MDSPAIEIRDLTHRYPPAGRRGGGADAAVPPALGEVSLSVEPGELFGILGPNGGGKTTLFRILSTLLRPTAGQVRLFGVDVLQAPAAARGLLGVVFQSPSLDGQLTAAENLMHQGHLYGLAGPDLAARIDDALATFGLGDRATERVSRFSGGMRRRVEIAKALLHRPRLLLLDEPSTGLDPGARRDLWNALVKLRQERGMTIALTTHYLDDADRCDRLAVLARGRLIALDSPANLKAAIRGDKVSVEAAGDAESLRLQVLETLGPWPQGAGPRVIDGRVHMETSDGPAFLARLMSALPAQVRSVTVGKPTLDDVFMHLTGRGLGDE